MNMNGAANALWWQTGVLFDLWVGTGLFISIDWLDWSLTKSADLFQSAGLFRDLSQLVSCNLNSFKFPCRIMFITIPRKLWELA